VASLIATGAASSRVLFWQDIRAARNCLAAIPTDICRCKESGCPRHRRRCRRRPLRSSWPRSGAPGSIPSLARTGPEDLFAVSAFIAVVVLVLEARRGSGASLASPGRVWRVIFLRWVEIWRRNEPLAGGVVPAVYVVSYAHWYFGYRCAGAKRLHCRDFLPSGLTCSPKCSSQKIPWEWRRRRFADVADLQGFLWAGQGSNLRPWD
jgi:hypothetical protein